LKFKNPLLEKFDSVAIRMGIKVADNYLSGIIPVEFHDEINDTVAGILAKDYATAMKEACELVAEILIKYVVPIIGKPDEYQLYPGSSQNKDEAVI